MFLHFCREWLYQLASKRIARRPARRQPPRSARLRLEPLEDRIVPAKFQYIDIVSHPDVLQNAFVAAGLTMPQAATATSDFIQILGNVPGGGSNAALLTPLLTSLQDFATGQFAAGHVALQTFAGSFFDAAAAPGGPSFATVQAVAAEVASLEMVVPGGHTLMVPPAAGMALANDFVMLNDTLGGLANGPAGVVGATKMVAEDFLFGNLDQARTDIQSFMTLIPNAVSMVTLSLAQGVQALKLAQDMNTHAGLGLQQAPVLLIQPIPGVTENGAASLNAVLVTFNGEQVTDADIQWGGGHRRNSDATITDNGDGTFSITATHRFNEEGAYTITVKVSIGEDTTVRGSTTVSVADAQEQNEHRAEDHNLDDDHDALDGDNSGSGAGVSPQPVQAGRIEFKV